MRLEMGRTGEQRSPKVHINPTLDFSGPQSFTEVPAWTFFQAYFTLPTFLNKIASVCYFSFALSFLSIRTLCKFFVEDPRPQSQTLTQGRQLIASNTFIPIESELFTVTDSYGAFFTTTIEEASQYLFAFPWEEK